MERLKGSMSDNNKRNHPKGRETRKKKLFHYEILHLMKERLQVMQRNGTKYMKLNKSIRNRCKQKNEVQRLKSCWTLIQQACKKIKEMPGQKTCSLVGHLKFKKGDIHNGKRKGTLDTERIQPKPLP